MPSVSILAAPDNFRITQPEPIYDPNGQRPCSACGSRTNWRRLVDDLNPGGWACCTPHLTDEHHPEMRHACGTLCGLDGAA